MEVGSWSVGQGQGQVLARLDSSRSWLGRRPQGKRLDIHRTLATRRRSVIDVAICFMHFHPSSDTIKTHIESSIRPYLLDRPLKAAEGMESLVERRRVVLEERIADIDVLGRQVQSLGKSDVFPQLLMIDREADASIYWVIGIRTWTDRERGCIERARCESCSHSRPPSSSLDTQGTMFD